VFVIGLRDGRSGGATDPQQVVAQCCIQNSRSEGEQTAHAKILELQSDDPFVNGSRQNRNSGQDGRRVLKASREKRDPLVSIRNSGAAGLANIALVVCAAANWEGPFRGGIKNTLAQRGPGWL
jgi:hypothetical protein